MAQGNFLSVYSYVMVGNKEDRGSLLTGAQGQERTRGHIWRYREFHLDLRKGFFHWKASITLKWVAKADCGVFVLGDN